MSETKKSKKTSDSKETKKKTKKKAVEVEEDIIEEDAKENKEEVQVDNRPTSRFQYEQVGEVEVKNCIIKFSKRSDGCLSFAPEKSFTRDGQEITFIPKNSSIVLLREDARDLMIALGSLMGIGQAEVYESDEDEG